jgi:crossover junction endodeoxyribonuclease RusA
MTALHVILPWPPSTLSPNSRAHWRTLASAKAAYRRACWALTREALGVDFPRPLSGMVDVALEFVPPDRRLRDLDNCIASMKSGLDGLADAIQIDDRRFRLIAQMAEAGTVGGFVRVRIGQDAG